MSQSNFPGAIVRQLRTARGITQTDFAVLVGIKRPYLNAVEAGKKDPSLPLLRKCAKQLEVPVALLLMSEGGPAKGIYKELLGLLENALAFNHHAKQNA